jgi:hypothetical protein
MTEEEPYLPQMSWLHSPPQAAASDLYQHKVLTLDIVDVVEG